MWILLLMALLLVVSPSFAEQSFSEQYKRDYNIFNPANRFDPGNPVNPANRYAPDNPFNPANRYNPDNPLNPANRYNPTPPSPRSTARGDPPGLAPSCPTSGWR